MVDVGNDKTGSDGYSGEKSTDLGEHKIIEILASYFETMPDLPVPFGDDVAAVNLDQKQAAVLKTDMLVGKTDVPRNMSLMASSTQSNCYEHQRFCLQRCPADRLLLSHLGYQEMLCKKTLKKLPKD